MFDYLLLACLFGCWDGSTIYVNPALPEPIHFYVLTHETCHAQHTDIVRARADYGYLLQEEGRCHLQAFKALLGYGQAVKQVMD
jgi:hypothetical protein